jgi:hypothetical protein
VPNERVRAKLFITNQICAEGQRQSKSTTQEVTLTLVIEKKIKHGADLTSRTSPTDRSKITETICNHSQTLNVKAWFIGMNTL